MPLNGKKLSIHSVATCFIPIPVTAGRAHPAVYDPESMTAWYWPNIVAAGPNEATSQATRSLGDAWLETAIYPWDERTARWNIYPVPRCEDAPRMVSCPVPKE